MPDQDGKLTEAEKLKVLNLVKKPGLFGHVKCPVCSSTEWLIADHLVQAATLGANNSVQLGGIGYPFSMAISPCGHTLFFNAVVLGFLPPAPTDKK